MTNTNNKMITRYSVTRKGFKHTALGWIPEDWDVQYFEDVAEIDKECLPNNTPNNYKFKYISLSDIDSEIIEIKTTQQVFETAPSRARRIVKEGNILMSTVRPNLLGFTIIKEDIKDLIASTGFAVISTVRCHNEYLYHFLFTSILQKQFYQLIVGSNYPAINSSDVKKLKILLPPFSEQKAIAALLSTWDKAITNCQLLIDNCQLRKKWLMQQLLTGKKRLQGFNGKWETKKISTIAEEVSIKNKDNKGLTVLSCTKYDGLVPSLEYFGRKIFADDLTTYKVVPKHHFAYATNHIEEGSIGYQNEFEAGLISPMYTVFKTNGKVNDNYLFRLLKTNNYILEYQKRMEGSINRRGGLRWDEFSKIRIPIPSLEEQTAITNILQNADKEITFIKHKLEALKEQKKGLMQVLLSGQKRLI